MPLKLDALIPDSQVLAESLEDPQFRAEWERTAPARAVAAAVTKYRADHNLSQRQLASRLGVSQPLIARLELGEHNPTFETLQLLADKLGMELLFNIGPRAKRAPWVNKRPAGAMVFEDMMAPSGTRFAFAARGTISATPRSTTTRPNRAKQRVKKSQALADAS